MKYRYMMKGALTYVPGLLSLAQRAKGDTKGGSTDSAEYCYGVWIKHLTLLHASGMQTIPSRMIEVGPGGSIGVGICALLSGLDKYSALDVTKHADPDNNLAVFDQCIKRFKERAPYPGGSKIADIAKGLDSNGFPSGILTDAVLKRSMSERRLDEIRRNLKEPQGMVEYVAPWSDPSVVASESIDLIISHSVMEHVNDPADLYVSMAKWCRPSGYMSHSIDYQCHATADKWYGHWMYSQWEWKLIFGNRPYLINRCAHSHHRAFQERAGFTILNEYREISSDIIQRDRIRVEMQEDDINCMGAVILSRKNIA